MASRDDRKTAHRSIAEHGVKYLLVGGSSALIELAVFQTLLALSPLGVGPSNVVALVSSTTFNFLMNRNFTFKSASNPARSLVLYLLLFAFNTTLTTMVLSVLVGEWGWNSVFSKLLTMACVTLWNFVLYRKVVFR